MKLNEITKKIIHVDLDGVLADFDIVVKKLFGKSYDQLTNENLWSKLHEIQDFYRNLPKMPDADKLWRYLHKEHSDDYKIQILTAIPRRVTMPTAEQDKRDWVKEHFGHHVVVNIGPHSRDKKKHAKPGDILIDDRKDNIEGWREAGGIGILHKSAEDTIEKLKSITKEK